MKATVVYVSKEDTMAIVAIEKQHGPVISEVSGWMKLTKDHGMKKGSTFELPDNAVVNVVTNKEFNKLVISGI